MFADQRLSAQMHGPSRWDRDSSKAACYFSVYEPRLFSLSLRQQIADLIGREKSKSFRAIIWAHCLLSSFRPDPRREMRGPSTRDEILAQRGVTDS